MNSIPSHNPHNISQHLNVAIQNLKIDAGLHARTQMENDSPLGSQKSIFEIMGSVGNLPDDRQAEFNKQSPRDGSCAVPQVQNGADWWTQMQSMNTPPNLFQPSPPKKLRHKHRNEVNRPPPQAHPTLTNDENPYKLTSARVSSGNTAAAYPIYNNEKDNHQRQYKDSILVPPHVTSLRIHADIPSRMSDSSDTSVNIPPEENVVPLINIEQKSPPIWAIGTLVVIIVVFACEIIQAGGFSPMSINPLYGPDSSTLLTLGAKYGPSIAEGEYWRFFSPIWMSSGVIHIAISVILIFVTMSVERDSGFQRSVSVFIISGAYGFILSSLLIPDSISVGTSGALFGLLGIKLSDLLSSWRANPKPGTQLTIILVTMIVTLAAGLTPYLDNFLHIGGFVIGFLCALMLLPNLTFGKWERICHGLIAFMAFPAMTLIFMLTLVLFMRTSGSVDCAWCYYLNCVNISGWCPSSTENSADGIVYYLK